MVKIKVNGKKRYYSLEQNCTTSRALNVDICVFFINNTEEKM
jgi:hypothetical protein